jgi:hypothetical protein
VKIFKDIVSIKILFSLNYFERDKFHKEITVAVLRTQKNISAATASRCLHLHPINIGASFKKQPFFFFSLL